MLPELVTVVEHRYHPTQRVRWVALSPGVREQVTEAHPGHVGQREALQEAAELQADLEAEADRATSGAKVPGSPPAPPTEDERVVALIRHLRRLARRNPTGTEADLAVALVAVYDEGGVDLSPGARRPRRGKQD